MTLATNIEIFYFSPNSILNFRKIYQIWWKLAQEQNVTGKQQKSGWKTPPSSAYRVKSVLSLIHHNETPKLNVYIKQPISLPYSVVFQRTYTTDNVFQPRHSMSDDEYKFRKLHTAAQNIEPS